MAHREENAVSLVVEDEKALYTTLSPDDEFSEPVKKYIRAKILCMDHSNSINLTVISKKPIDEDRFRSAMSNWGRDELALLKIDNKDTVRTLIGLLAFGSVMVILSLALQNRFDFLSYSLMPIMGSLALGNAAGILTLDLPTYGVKKRMITEMGEHSFITFVYDSEKQD